jgi:hypothetical protein
MASLGNLFSNGLKGNIVSGLAIGVGVAILAPVVIPVLAGIAKPLAKGAIKGGILVYEKGKEIYGEATEVVEDLAAEARSELSAAHKEGAAAAAPGEKSA